MNKYIFPSSLFLGGFVGFLMSTSSTVTWDSLNPFQLMTMILSLGSALAISFLAHLDSINSINEEIHEA